MSNNEKTLVKITSIKTCIYALKLSAEQKESKDSVKQAVLPFIEDSDYEVDRLDDEFEGVESVQFQQDIFIDTVNASDIVNCKTGMITDMNQKAYSASFQYPFKV